MRNKWDKQIVEGFHTFTETGKTRRASYREVCQWIVVSCSEITANCIKNGFKNSLICDYPTKDLEDYSSEIESGLEIPENFDV